MTLRKRIMERLVNFYPPFLGAGIKVKSWTADTIRVEMKLTPLNRNYVGTHFGGSLYAMCDPFFMLLLLKALGPEYIVWDKAAAIRFRQPGRGTVAAEFHIAAERAAEIRAAADAQGKVEPVFNAVVVGTDGETVAEIEKTLYVRRK